MINGSHLTHPRFALVSCIEMDCMRMSSAICLR